jgi:DNA-binding winged helix-turn-helix (wHTH) protein
VPDPLAWGGAINKKNPDFSANAYGDRASIEVRVGCMATQPTFAVDPPMASEPKGVLSLTSRYIRFGPFQLDRNRQEVSKYGERLKLQGKAYQVLLALIEKQGETVTREELKVRLWPAETQVNYDANVNTTVNKLRQALGDSSGKPLYIETIPRAGYCLIVPTESGDDPMPVPTFAASPTEQAQTDSRQAPTKGTMWITLGIIALILLGMFIGMAITRL